MRNLSRRLLLCAAALLFIPSAAFFVPQAAAQSVPVDRPHPKKQKKLKSKNKKLILSGRHHKHKGKPA